MTLEDPVEREVENPQLVRLILNTMDALKAVLVEAGYEVVQDKYTLSQPVICTMGVPRGRIDVTIQFHLPPTEDEEVDDVSHTTL